MTGVQWIQIIFVAIGAINVYVMFGLSRSSKKKDEHETEHKRVNERLQSLENGQLKEDRFRMILKEELGQFELRLINEGRLEPKMRGSHEY